MYSGVRSCSEMPGVISTLTFSKVFLDLEALLLDRLAKYRNDSCYISIMSPRLDRKEDLLAVYCCAHVFRNVPSSSF
jgi:hypothetical protein